jgi:hypothetical protein
MACETEEQLLADAVLALDTSILAIDAAIAVMKANVEAVKQRQLQLAICRLNATNPPNPPGP